MIARPIVEGKARLCRFSSFLTRYLFARPLTELPILIRSADAGRVHFRRNAGRKLRQKFSLEPFVESVRQLGIVRNVLKFIHPIMRTRTFNITSLQDYESRIDYTK